MTDSIVLLSIVVFMLVINFIVKSKKTSNKVMEPESAEDLFAEACIYDAYGKRKAAASVLQKIRDDYPNSPESKRIISAMNDVKTDFNKNSSGDTVLLIASLSILFSGPGTSTCNSADINDGGSDGTCDGFF